MKIGSEMENNENSVNKSELIRNLQVRKIDPEIPNNAENK